MFTTPLRAEFLKNGYQIRLLEDLVWEDEDYRITVDEGFECDLASVPRLLQRVFKKLGKYNYAAVLHDALYHWSDETPTGQWYGPLKEPE